MKSASRKEPFLPQSLSDLLAYRGKRFLVSKYVSYVNELCRSLDVNIQELDKIVSRSYVKRLVHHSDDEAAINEHIQAITWSLQSLTVRTYLFIFEYFYLAQYKVESLLSIEFALDVSAHLASW